MIIDKNYPGLHRDVLYYVYDNDIINKNIKDDIIINVPFKINGNIKTTGSIIANDILYVNGTLKTGLFFHAQSWVGINRDLIAEGAIKVNKWLEVGGNVKANSSLEVNDSLDVEDSLHVAGGMSVCKSVTIGNIFSFRGNLHIGSSFDANKYVMNFIESDSLIIINTYEYMIYVSDTHIKIGCELHSKEEWKKFTDKDVLKMGGKYGKIFWDKYKHWILHL